MRKDNKMRFLTHAGLGPVGQAKIPRNKLVQKEFNSFAIKTYQNKINSLVINFCG